MKDRDIEFAITNSIDRDVRLKPFGEMSYYTFGKHKYPKNRRKKVDCNQINCYGKIYRDRKMIEEQLNGTYIEPKVVRKK